LDLLIKSLKTMHFFRYLIEETKKAVTDPRSLHHAHSEYEGEYVQNDHTKQSYPEAFKDKHEFARHYMNSKIKHRTHLDDVDNSSTSDVNAGDHEKSFKIFHDVHGERFKSPKHAKKYYNGMVKAAKNGKLPPTIVGVHKNKETGEVKRHLIGGNTRAMIHKAHGIPTPVVEVPLRGKHVPQHKRLGRA